MDGLFDKFGKTKQKSNQSPTRTVKRMLSIKPKQRSQRQIITNNATFEPGAAEIHFAQDKGIPPKDQVNTLFSSMLERRGIHDLKMKQNMEKWNIEKKWLMINQEHQAELLGGMPRKSIDDCSVQPQKSISTPIRHEKPSPIAASSSTMIPTKKSPVEQFFTLDPNSPEFFVRKFLDPNLRSVTTAIAARLEVSLRTRSIDWVAMFIQLKGYHVLSYALDYLNHTAEYRKDVSLDLEVEIVKCIKAIMNTRIGKQETMDHPEYIHTVVFSILCPRWQTRKMVCELLAFLCYSDGYEHVVRGFEILKKFRKDLGLFDSWMRELDRTVTDVNRRIPGNHLLDYALSNMILVNALLKVPADVNDRIYMGNQFNASGFQSILPKLKAFDYDLLDIQLDDYNDTLESDMDEAFGEDMSLYSDISQPSELFDRVVESISESPRASEQFMSLLKYLLWIRGDSDTKYRYYRMIQIITQQIVMDQRPHDNTESFSSTFGVAVGAVIQSYCELERLKGIEPELRHLRSQYDALVAEKEELQAEMAKLRILPTQLELQDKDRCIHQLKKENDSQRDLLRTSKETIAILQNCLVEENIQTVQPSETISTVRASGRFGKNIMNAGSIALGNLFSPLLNKKANKKQDIRSIDREPNEDSSNRDSIRSDKIPPSLPPTSGAAPPSPPPPPPSASTPGIFPNNVPPPPPPPPPLETKKDQTPPSKDSKTQIPIPPHITPSRKELTHYPQIKLKNLQWQKMDARTTHQTLWDTEDSSRQLEDTLDQKGVFHTLDTLFPAKQNDFLEKRLQSKKADVENDSIKFLKKEKNRNITILPQIKQLGSFEATRKHILAMDDALCTETFLTNLITYLPNRGDDLITMEKYMKATKRERQDLDLPEQFTVEMMSIYRYEARLKYMLFRVQFWERFDRLKTSLSVVLSACDSLCESEAWKELLLIVLTLGNYMNASSLQGGAYGFRIASINKLIDTKASDSSHLTLLHVLSGIVRRQFSHVLKFIEDIKDVPQAARIMSNISDIVQEYTDMRQGLKQLGIELDTYWKEVDFNQDRFHVVMEEHRRSVTGRFEEIETLYINMDAKWKNLMLFYGESPQLMRPEEFFHVFSRFIHSWKTCAYEELKYTQAKEREEKRIQEGKKINTQRIEQRQDEDGPLVDDLLAKLRSGESLTKTRKSKVHKSKPTRKVLGDSLSSTSSFIPSAEDLLRNLQADQ